MSAGSPTPRMQPSYCPYCGEQDMRPTDPSGYHCRVCDRHFELTFLGLGGSDGKDR